MSVTRQSQYLLTGSEDTSVIVWDLRAFSTRLRIYEHIAPVLCITSALNNSIIISGGDDSSIIITSLANGKVVMYQSSVGLIVNLPLIERGRLGLMKTRYKIV